MPGKKQKQKKQQDEKSAKKSSKKHSKNTQKGKVVSLADKRRRQDISSKKKRKTKASGADIVKFDKARSLRFRIPDGLRRFFHQSFFSRAGGSTDIKQLLRRFCTVDGLVAVMLAVLLFYPPYFRGLFFSWELLPTHMYTAVIFSLFAFYKISRRELAFFRAPLDYAVFILLGLYLTSSITAWNVREAVGMILKMANYTAVYWLLAYSVRSLSAVRGYLAVYFASGVGVALLGLGAALGTFHYKDAFVNGRIYSSLQYPNTLAAFLTAINLFGLYLQAVTRKLPYRLLLSAGNYLLFLTFLGTQSRGAFLIYPLGLLILIAGLSGKVRWHTLGLFFVQVVSAVLVFGRVMACTGGKAPLAGWLWILAGAALAVGLQYIWHLVERQLTAAGQRRLRPWVLPTAAVLAVLIAAGGGYLALHGQVASQTAAEVMPQSWIERVRSISLQEKNAQERLIWSRDALKIMTARPVNAILGTGGGGWNSLYHQHQDYYYFSTEVHNHLMQVGVETGFPGMIAFLSIWVFFLFSTFRVMKAKCKEQDDFKGTSWAICSSALALGIHSLFDFNLSLGAVALFLWGMFGLGRGLERLAVPAAEAEPQRPIISSPIFQGISVGVAVFLMFFVSWSLFTGEKYAQAAYASMKEQDPQAVVTNLEKAAQYDPWKASYRAELGKILLDAGTRQKDSKALLLAQEKLKEAVHLDRGDASIRVYYASSLLRTGQVKEGVQQMEEALALAPFEQKMYDNLAISYVSAGRFLLEQSLEKEQSPETGQLKALAVEYLEKALQVPQRLERRMAAVPEQYLPYWFRAPHLTVTPALKLSSGEAAALLGRWEMADQYLADAADDANLQAEALLWRGLVLEQMGRTEEGNALTAQALQLNSELAGERERIKQLFPIE
jgi:Flp pilus assembly protein TadD